MQKDKHTLVLRKDLAILFHTSIQGQLSDGLWSNINPHDHWRFWSSLNVEVGPENEFTKAEGEQWEWNSRGGCLYPKKMTGYNLTNLMEYIAPEMIEFVKINQHVNDPEMFFSSNERDIMRGEAPSYMTRQGANDDGIYNRYFDVIKKVQKGELVFDYNYDEKQLKKDLQELKKVMKMVLSKF
tara:strand:+ start:1708 stop:2256 length:549 start_codon:yes stop_codon:yes gene_type:complete